MWDAAAARYAGMISVPPGIVFGATAVEAKRRQRSLVPEVAGNERNSD